MINPYLPDMNKISYAYNHLVDKEKEVEDAKKWSLTHPYKTSDSVIGAINRGGSDVDILSKMDPSLRKDPQEMLKLIECTPAAYGVVHKDIATDEFKKQAIFANPSVYSMLSNDERQNQEVSDAYRVSMLNHMKRMPIDATTMAMQFQQQFSPVTNKEQVFSEQSYEDAFERMVKDGPYLKDGTLGKDFALTSTALMLREDMRDRYAQIQSDVWRRNEDKVMDLAYGDRRFVVRNEALNAIEERCPEMKPMIDQKQKDYWQSREAEVLALMDRQDNGEGLSGEQQRLILEADKHLKLEEKRRLEVVRQQREREVNNAYRIRSLQDEAYSRAAVGDISDEQAYDIASNVGNTPKTTTASVATSEIARHADVIDDVHNVDENREQYLEVSGQANNPSLTPEEIVDEIEEIRHIEEWETHEEEIDERTDEERYEEEYAGNPFVSFVPSEGMEHTYNPYG